MNSPSKPHILIVDDDLTVGLLARETLTQGEFSVSLAHNAAQMRESLQSSRVDIILLDVQLPDASGIDLCTELRATDRHMHTPILMITGSDDSESIQLAYRAGATDFMPKPLNWYLLVQRVRYMWRSFLLLLQSKENEKLLAQAQSMAMVGNWERNIDTGSVSTSEQFVHLFGNPEWSETDSFLPFLDTIPAAEQAEVARAMKDVAASGRRRTLEHRVKRPDGNLRSVRHTMEVRRDPRGKPVALCGTIQDITRDKLRSQLAADRNHILEQVLQNATVTELYASLERLLITQIPGSSLGVLNKGRTGWDCEYCSPPLSAMHGAGEVVFPQEVSRELERFGGTSKVLHFALDGFPEFRKAFATLDILPVLIGGESVPSMMICIFSPLESHKQDATDMTEVLHTISGISAIALENYRLSRDLHYQAFHDTLTGLPNRFRFLDRLSQMTAAGKRTGEKRAVVFIDLDRFKNTNDLLGHNFGDKVLTEFGRRLSGAVQPDSILARTGGDEFMLISSPLQHYEEIEKICTRVMRALSTPFEEDNYSINLSASLGVSLFPADSDRPDTLYQYADLAMQHAKKAGGNTVRYYDKSIMNQFLERLEIENELSRALESGEFHLVYQPQVDVATGAVVAYETLTRWQKPDGRFISPATFIPVAEDNGFIVTLGAWVLELACRQMGRLHATGESHLKLAVNVSTVQFVQDNFIDVVSEILDKTEFPPDRLELEVTESAVMHDIEIVAARLNSLRSLGITIAIDDFGTGYSSMSYLKSLPIDSLKIDRCFITEIGTDHFEHEKSGALVEALINLADNLGLSVVAEGVENAEQLEFLRSRKCPLVQGYFTGRPGPLPGLPDRR